MANVRSANTYYIDTAAVNAGESTAGNLTSKNIRVLYVIITSTAAAASCILKDVSTDIFKAEFRVDTAHKTEYYDFNDHPMVFPNGIYPQTVNDCIVTLIVQEAIL
jgi:hypothetical protein